MLGLGFGFGCGGLVLAKGTTTELQPASARVGVFATANYFVDTTLGRGPDLVLGSTIICAFWRSNGTTNNQFLWGYNTATSGWYLLASNTRSVNLFFRNSGFTVVGTTYFGLNIVAITRKSDGTLRCSVNGEVARTLTSPGSYITASGSAAHAIGRNHAEASQPATQHSAIWNAFISGELSDAELQSVSGQANALDRFNPPSFVRNHASLTWLWEASAWDGSSSTANGVGNAGGASPYTMTKQGTGGGKTVIPAYLRYAIPDNAVWDGIPTIPQGSSGATGTCRNFGATTKFTCDAADITDGPAGLIVDSDVSAWSGTGLIMAGVAVSGTKLAGNNNGVNPIPGLVQTTGYCMKRAVDCPGIVSGSGKTFEITEGLQSGVGTRFSASSPTHVRVPATTPITWVSPTAPADKLVIVHDSIGMQITGVTDVTGVKGPAYTSWTMQVRAALAGTRRVQCEGWGFGTLAERIKLSSDRTAFVDKLVRICTGTSTNWVYLDLGTNDYPGAGAWSNLTTELEPALLSMLTDLFSRGIPGLKVKIATPNKRTDVTETNNNTASTPWNLPALRTSYGNVVTSFANANCTLVSAINFVSDVNRPDDGLHPNQAGHDEKFTNFSAITW